ncbi:MAG TPA: hypothetical protein VI976_03505, partial [Candidatus Omnitrophota bacterium]|nr:hypothetical protein [Candidatus Omnitrophota bacterium]
IGLPFLTEMYVNFGPLAVIAGMFILGLVYRALYAILNHPQAGEGGFVIAVMIFKQFLNIDSYFALIAGSVLQYILLFYIIARRMQAPVGRIGEIK